MSRLTAVALCLACTLQAQQIASDWLASLNRVRADSLKGHLSFLASDALEGRDTPSRGLDVAAEYIASQFRRAGLDPAGSQPGSYFHDSERVAYIRSRRVAIRIHRAGGEQVISAVAVSPAGVSVVREPILPMPAGQDGEIAAKDAVLVVAAPTGASAEGVTSPSASAKLAQAFLKRLTDARPKAVVVVDPTGAWTRLLSSTRIAPPQTTVNLNPAPVFFVQDFPANLPADARISVDAPPIEPRRFPLRNVAGILRGGDPALAGTYVVLSAHFDHVGRQPFGSGDLIYNGANDDASGTSALVELADALSRLPERPRRSILFLAVSGEEKGLLGSRAFAEAPSVPLASIVANLNMEHLGRPDADGDSYVGKATVTGFDFSTLGQTLADAGKKLRYEIFKHPKFSDPFFTASDNYSFAEKGIPAHTVSNGYLFAEYHALGDHWEKIDYANMERLTRTIGLAVLTVADAAVEPQWNESNAKTDAFREAQRRLRR